VMRRRLEGDAGAVTGPSNVVNEERAAQDADVAYALINARWNELIPWYAANGSSPQFPELTEFIKSWRAFQKAWASKKAWNTPIGFNWLDVVGYKTPEEALAGAAQDVAMAESNAIRRNYVLPRLFIGEDGTVVRDASDVGKATGVLSPAASPLGSPATGPRVTVTAPATPSLKTLHPVATRIDEAVPHLPDAPTLGLGLGALVASVCALLLASRRN